MKTEVALKKDSIENCAAYLANNIQFVADDLSPSGQGTLSQCANHINVMILPRYHRGIQVDFIVETGSELAQVALLKLMQLQSQEIVNYIRKRDHRFAVWVESSLMGFIRKAALKYEDRRLKKLAARYLF